MESRLPYNILRHIYDDFFVGKDTCDRYLEMLKSEDAQRLRFDFLLEPTQSLLEHPCAVEYLCKKNKYFKQMYKEHYVFHNKTFVLMETLESFVLSILMWLYH